MAFTPAPSGGRREIPVICPDCGFRSTVPPAAVARNNFFCGSCGKSLDLQRAFREWASGGAPGAPGSGASTAAWAARRDKGPSKYKSARKGRR